MKAPIISVQHLSHCFGSGTLKKQILFDVNLNLDQGEIVILTGPSGSGKTTLLTLVGGLRSVQAGNLKILGQNIQGASPETMRQTRKQMGYIFQEHNLLTFLTARQNVRLSLELHDKYLGQDIDQIATDILGTVGLDARVDYYADELSVGQKQRVAIARALVSKPKIVLADAPPASLERQSGRNIVNLMRRLATHQKCTILLVTHDNRILDIADRILRMEDGRLLN